MEEPKPDAPTAEDAAAETTPATGLPIGVNENQTPSQTPDAVKAELNKMAASGQSQGQPAGGPSSAPVIKNTSKMSKKMLVIILSAVLVAAGLGYYFYSKSNSNKPVETHSASPIQPSPTQPAPTPPATPPPAAVTQPPPSHIQNETWDVERETDINSLDSHVEQYYADNGEYPTLANMNSMSWITTNLRGLDPAALQDPQGTSHTIVSVPEAKYYAYQPTDDKGDACNDSTTMCTKFALTAVLSTGQQYQKTSH